MKSIKLLFVLFLSTLVWSCSVPTNDVIITGKIEGIEDSLVVSLSYPEKRAFVFLATDTIINGSFEFSIPDSIASKYKQLAIVPRSKGKGFPPTRLNIWTAPGAKIEISGKDKLLRTWDVKSNVKEQIEQNKYTEKDKLRLIDKQQTMRDAYSLFNLREQTQNQVEIDSISRKIKELYSFADSIELVVLKSELDLLHDNLTLSAFWFEKLKEHARASNYLEKGTYPDIDRLKLLYTQLSDEHKNSEIGKEIKTYLFPPIIVNDGDELVDTDLYDLEGNIHHLADSAGKYRLLDFWSVGCGPCIVALPEITEIVEKYKDRLTVVSINVDSKDMWVDFSTENTISGLNVNENIETISNGITMNYGVKGYPHYVMIAPDNKVITSWSGYGKGSLLKKMEDIIKK